MDFTDYKIGRLSKMSMEDLIGFMQGSLVKDFYYPNDQVIEALKVSMEELRKARMDIPSNPSESELPQKPFGLFVPPSVEQVIGRRTIEKEEDIINKRRSSSLRPVVPADGGTAHLPSPIASRLSRGGSSSRNSPAADSTYDTGTDGFNSSRASYGDYQSSRTSFVGSESAATMDTSSAITVVTNSKEVDSSNTSALSTANQIRQVSQQLQHISKVQVSNEDINNDVSYRSPPNRLRHSPSLESQYDNVNNIESMLNNMELEATEPVTVNGHYSSMHTVNNSRQMTSSQQSYEYHSHTEQMVQLNGAHYNGLPTPAEARQQRINHTSPSKSPPKAVVIPIQKQNTSPSTPSQSPPTLSTAYL